MNSLHRGSIHLGRIARVDLFLHWSWFVVAAIEIEARGRTYSSIGWNVLEYLALFLIVTLHEFGHAMACRQVGGIANRIVLWPLGGVAYVDPPPRPGAMLWSIAAGPLVNVALLPLLGALAFYSRWLGWAQSLPNLDAFLHAVFLINLGLLLFNLIPVYPLDGGQILRSLLWFGMGRARSLKIATVIGFVGTAAFFGLALWIRSLWIALLAAFFLYSCWQGLKQARLLEQMEKLPRRPGFRCPWCKTPPPAWPIWLCRNCGSPHDTFETEAICPLCGARNSPTTCPECGRAHPISDWSPTVLSPASRT